MSETPICLELRITRKGFYFLFRKFCLLPPAVPLLMLTLFYYFLIDQLNLESELDHFVVQLDKTLGIARFTILLPSIVLSDFVCKTFIINIVPDPEYPKMGSLKSQNFDIEKPFSNCIATVINVNDYLDNNKGIKHKNRLKYTIIYYLLILQNC